MYLYLIKIDRYALYTSYNSYNENSYFGGETCSLFSLSFSLKSKLIGFSFGIRVRAFCGQQSFTQTFSQK